MRGAPTSVLLVEDNPGDAGLVRLMLEQAPLASYNITHVTRLGDALPLIAAHGPDVVLLDLGLPDSFGLDTVVRTRRAAEATPVVVLTGCEDEALALQALEAGAQDYLVKGQIESELVTRTIRHAVQRQKLHVEAEQARLRELKLKDEFLSHVSHELRSPLTAVYMLVTVVRDALLDDLSEEHREYLEVAVKNLKQLATMIDDLLEVTRAEAGQMRVEPQRMRLDEIVADSVDTLRAQALEKGIALSLEGLPGLPSAFGDPARVRQVLLNLVGNAMKFTPRGGNIHLTTAASDDAIRVSVADSGCGIAEEHLAQVFERLFQVDGASQAGRSGLGLGLYICKQIIERHNGRIWAESVPGSGSTFSFTLPRFSLRRLLAPLQELPGVAQRDIALVTVELRRPPSGVSTSQWKDLLRVARHVVQQSVLPDLDVVMPSVRRMPDTETLAVVSCADTKGVAVLTSRLEKQLARQDRLTRAQIGWTVQSTTLDVNSWLAEGVVPPSGDWLDALAAVIETVLYPSTDGV